MMTQTQVQNPVEAKKYFEQKMKFTTGPAELDEMMKHDDVKVIDVRAAEDFEDGHVPGSINLPRDRWETMEGLEKDKTNVILCYSQVCHLATKAALEFAGRGFPVMEMDGGFKAWKEQDLEVEK